MSDAAKVPETTAAILNGWRKLLRKRVLVKTHQSQRIDERYVREVSPGGHIRLAVTWASDGSWYAVGDVELCEVLE